MQNLEIYAFILVINQVAVEFFGFWVFSLLVKPKLVFLISAIK